MGKFLKARRVVAYMLDNVIMWLLFQFIVAILYTLGVFESIKGTGFSMASNILSIVFVFVYYIYFWCKSKLEATPGQLACRLKIKKRAVIEQCVKRMVFMHISTIFFAGAIIYMFIFGIEVGMQQLFLFIAMPSALVMQLIYAVHIDRVDKITGIEIEAR